MITVLKFGGSSVATIEKINEIAKYLKMRISRGEKLVVVLSAMGDETDLLLELADGISNTPNARELDRLLSTGEIKTISLMAMKLQAIGVDAKSMTGEQVGFLTAGDHLNAKALDIDCKMIEDKLNSCDCLIVAGFQGVNAENEVTTLGRGGSDTSAVAIAAKLGVSCEIYTDVDGIYTTDPRLYPKARKKDYISYEEMTELATLGANVMHNRSVIIASKYNVKLYVGKTLSDEKGTYIMNRNMIEQNVISALAVENDVQSTSIKYCSKSPIESEVMKEITTNKINIDMVSQVYFDNETSLAFSHSAKEQSQVVSILEKLSDENKLSSYTTNDYAKVSLVGSGMRDAYGVVSRVFKTLADCDVKAYQITTSEISISLLIKQSVVKRAVSNLMEEFELGEE